MKHTKLLVVLIVILGLIAAGKTIFAGKTKEMNTKEQTKNVALSQANTQTLGASDSAQPSESIPTEVPTQAPSPQPTSSNDSGKLSAFRYPNATVSQSDESSLTLQSSDDPAVVTNWYKEKLAGTGFSSKSVVQTKNNGNVLNKMSAANANEKIDIKITRNVSDYTTQIKVDLSAS